MDNKQQQELRDQSQKDFLERAGAYEELVRTKGWEWLMANFQTRVQVFTTNVLTSDRPIEEFEHDRQQIVGIKKLIADVQGDLDALVRYRKEQDGKNA